MLEVVWKLTKLYSRNTFTDPGHYGSQCVTISLSLYAFVILLSACQ